MLRNFFKSTLRNLIKYKGHSLINVICLTTGIVVFLLAVLWVNDELQYDKFNANYQEIHRVIVEKTTSDKTETSIFSPAILGNHLQDNYPQVVNSCRFLDIPVGWLVETDEKKFRNDRIMSADPSFFSMFSFPLKSGKKDELMPDDNSIIISQSMAQKYFGNENPIGKTIRIEVFPFTVTGVISDVPAQSHLQFDCVIPYNFWEDFYRMDLDNWDMNLAYTYLQFSPNTNTDNFFDEISTLLKEKSPEKDQRIIGQSLADIHLKSNYDHDLASGHGNLKTVRIFSLAAFLVLLIAIINYMNLSTAHSSVRFKEIGIKKVIGASRKSLIYNLLGESLIFTLLAFGCAIAIIEIFLPSFNQFTGKELSISQIFNFNLGLMTIIILGFTALAGGLYPAFVISNLQPLSIIKNTGAVGNSKQMVRKVLVIFQYAISMFAIIAAILIFKQMSFINTKNLGFDKDHVLYFIIRGDFQSNFESAKQELLTYPSIQEVSFSRLPDENTRPENDVSWSGKDQDYAFIGGSVGIDHFKTFGMNIVDGRSFRATSADSSNFIVNETAARLISAGSPVGMPFTFRGVEGTIVGVVQDYHHTSFHKLIQPKVHYLGSNIWVCVRINPMDIEGSLAAIRTIWDRSAEGYPFEYRFMDEDVQRYYGAEKQIEKAISIISLLTILISSLGLLGLVAHSVNRRRKEIGIRKVLGASVSSVLLYLIGDFTKWILVANIIAWPIAWYVGAKWLQTFAYHIDIDLWVFVFSGVLALVVALVTIGFHTLKAATANPVKSLKYE
jgi:putative ABC transport system permease protein